MLKVELSLKPWAQCMWPSLKVLERLLGGEVQLHTILVRHLNVFLGPIKTRRAI